MDFKIINKKRLDDHTDLYEVEIDGKKERFAGRFYDRLEDAYKWQFGLCPKCRNVSGRTSLYRTDYCFCIEDGLMWPAGENAIGDYKSKWYSMDIKESNQWFLEHFGMAEDTKERASLDESNQICPVCGNPIKKQNS